MSYLQTAANHLVTDLNMLMDGEWVPDADSCQASIDNAVLLADFLPQLESVLELAAAGNIEYDSLQAKAADILKKLEVLK